MESLQGTQLKGYKLEERIGNGGFGAVYRAKQTTIGREVAIKIILPGFANDPGFIRRFESEANLIARLEHPHITPLHDFWRDPSGAYLVMRYLRSGSVRDALRDGPYQLPALSHLLDQIAAALDFAHRNDVVHRDIKPGNILLDEDGNAYLADFGIAKDLAGVNEQMTAADAVVGSLDYISPEQARSEPVTPRTDIYSLGVTLYEMITGEHPFQNASSVERLYKHINDPLPEIVNLPGDVRDAINELISRATAKNPDDRYSDVMALAMAFRESIGIGGTRDESIVEQLTMREQEILALIASGMSNGEIANELVVTLGTVKWHIRQLYSKLGVRSRVQAIVRARELDLIVNGDTIDSFSVSKTSVTAISLPEPENPYKGLHAFQMTDARDFFGRDELTAKMIEQMCDDDPYHRFLAIVGPSGSGKSSLVKAGLIPALWKGAIDGSEKWFVVDMIPGTHPLDKLETALIRVAANQTSNLREQLQRDERGLLRISDIILPGDGTELVIVVDQFEEVFTLVEDEAQRQHFLDLLRVAVSDVRSRVRVVVTLRADYYDRPLHYPEFGQLIRNRMETILPLSAKGLERAVRGPAERVGVTFEQGLVEQIVSAMNYQAGALPLLQYALTEMFDRRQGRLLTNDAYTEIGGAVGALANRADEIYRQLTEEAQALTHQMFMRLVTLGEGAEDTRRRATHAELLSLTDNTDLMEEIIDQFAAYRLLSLDHDPETRQPTLEVAHEAILREWDRLRGWLNDSRDDIRQERAVSRAAEDWTGHNRDGSYLLRGARLEQVEKWQQITTLIQTPLEQEFVAQSLQQREEEQRAEIQRKRREAILEQRARNFLRGLVAVLTLATLVALGLAAVAINQGNIAERNATEAQNVALVSGSQAALARGNTDEALALAMEAITLNPQSSTAQIALGQAAYAPGTVRRFVGHTDEVTDVDFSPDGLTAISGSKDGTLILWDIETGSIIRQFVGGHEQGGNIQVDFSPDGQSVISGSDDGFVILRDANTGVMMWRSQEHTDWVGSVAFSPNGLTALSSSGDQTLIFWDVQTGNVIRQFTGHTHGITSVAFEPDGRTALSGSLDNVLISWDVQTGSILQQWEGEVMINELAISPDGQSTLVTTNNTTLAYLWDLSTGEVIRELAGHVIITTAAAFSPDGQTAVTGGADSNIIQWDLQTGQAIRMFQNHEGQVNRVKYSPDGRYILSASTDKTLRLWELLPGQIIHRFGKHDAPAWNAAFSPDGQTTLSVSWRNPVSNGTVRLWDIETGEELRFYTVESGGIWGVSFAPDSRTAILGLGDFSTQATVPGETILWDIETGEEIRRFVGQPAQIHDVEFSPDGQTFVAGSADGSLFLWDVETGEILRRFVGHTANAWDIAFSPDGSRLLSGSFNGEVILWDVQTGEILHHVEYPQSTINTVAFSPDGLTAVIGADTGAHLWDLMDGTQLHHFPNGVGAAFSPDGQLLLIGKQDNTNVLWDLTTRTAIRQYLDAGEPLMRHSFSADGKTVLNSFFDGRVELWRIDTFDELVAWTQANRYVPELTCDQRELYQVEPFCTEDESSF